MYRVISLLFIITLISGCGYVVPTVGERVSLLDKLTDIKGLKRRIIETKEFDIFSVSKDLSMCKSKLIDLYIEGDGLPWITSSRVSSDPTPLNPIGLKLFLQDFHKCSIYLARPCQYTSSSTCRVKYWTNKRFSPEIIDSFNEALDKIKSISQASSFRLFGYSGGGAVAVLLAARRDDIDELVTIVGNLDINEWAREHYLTPLHGSLNPADFSYKLSRTNQTHLIGGKDKITGKEVFKSYLKRFRDKSYIKYKIFSQFDHHCCWEENWRSILKGLDERREDKF